MFNKDESQQTLSSDEANLEMKGSVLSWDDRVLVWKACKVCGAVPCNVDMDGQPFCKDHISGGSS